MKSLVRFVTAFAVVTLLALPAAASAATSSEPAQPNDEQIAQEMSKQLKISIGDARDRVETQNRASGLTEDLQAALGGDYAGMWISDQGQVKVGILNESDRPAIEKALTQHRLPTEGAFSPVDTSAADLAAAHYDIDAVMMRQPDEDRELVSTGTDFSENTLDVNVQPGLSEKTRALLERLKADFAKGRSAEGPPLPPENPSPLGNPGFKATPQPARVRKVDVEIADTPKVNSKPMYCAGDSCSLPLRGGVAITNAPSPGAPGAACSAGFMGKWWNGSRYIYFDITAGHCLQYSAYNDYWAHDPLFQMSDTVGMKWAWRMGTLPGTPSYLPTFDAGIIGLSDNTLWSLWVPWPGEIWMNGWPGGEDWVINTQNAAYETEFGCRTGWATPYSCGQIGYSDLTWTYPGSTITVSGLLWVPGACMGPGDSGGAYLDGNNALGMSSGNLWINGCYGGLFGRVTDVTAWMGVSIL